MKYFSPDEVIQFIKYIQFETIQLTKDNIFTLHYLGRKYEINQLVSSTEKYINQQRKELLRNADLSFYEDKIAANFSAYVNNDDIISLDISTLYRILEKVSEKDEKELKSTSTKDFLMKVLNKHGRPASILFKYADISAFDEETLTHLLTKYSQNFDFEFITAAVLNAYLSMKKEHNKYEEESAKKYDTIANELQEQKSINIAMKSTLEKERREHKKYEEESTKKYDLIYRELQEQKNINDRINNQLLKSQSENKQLRAKEESEKREHEELHKKLDQLKKQVTSMSARKKGQDDERGEDKFYGFISICKYGDNMIINNNANNSQINNLVKYLINEKDNHEKKTKSVKNIQEILFLRRKQAITEDDDNVSSHTEEDIFISNDMINIMIDKTSERVETVSVYLF